MRTDLQLVAGNAEPIDVRHRVVRIVPGDAYEFRMVAKTLDGAVVESAFRPFQTTMFTAIDTGLPSLKGNTSWGDFDGDGRMDACVNLSIYRNLGSGTFELVQVLGSPASLGPGITQWGDYDGDGDLDLLVPKAFFRNDGNEVGFVQVPLQGASANRYIAQFIDYDQDGDEDLVYAYQPENATSQVIEILRHDGNDVFTVLGVKVPPSADRVTAMFAEDVDADGDLDLALGRYPQSVFFKDEHLWYVDVHFNDGTGPLRSFHARKGPRLAGRGHGWFDFDGDGNLDLASERAIHRQTAEGEWEEIPLPYSGRLIWSDFDNDGDGDYLHEAPQSTYQAPMEGCWAE